MKTLIILDDKNEILEKFEIPEYLLVQIRRWKEGNGKDYKYNEGENIEFN